MSERPSLKPLSLSLRGIAKRFGTTVALDGADLTVRAGTLHALLGENGAGKTTLMRVAFGMLRVECGAVVVDGVQRDFRSSADAIAAGIGMVHQHFLLVGAMTVAENVALGDVALSGFVGGFSARSAARRVRQLGEEVGLALDPSTRVEELPIGAQQRLELVKALARDARLLVLDEPTAVLAPGESAELYRWLRAFVDRGGTIVLVTHKLREALELADDVTVLRHGRTVLSGPAGNFDEGIIVGAMLGERELVPGNLGTAIDCSIGEALLRLEGVSVVDEAGIARLNEVTLDVHAGEIVGVVGLEGSGRLALLRLLAGRLAASSGRLTCPDVVGFVPEDRLHDALIPEMSLVENAALVGAGATRGRVPWRALTQRVAQFIEEFEIVAPGPRARVSELSGGNQQKFVLARELFFAKRALVVENPTRGLDIRAANRVLRDIVRAARVQGAAVVFHSSDLEEILGIADRVFVCFAGNVREVPTDEPAVIARAMVGAA